MTTRTGSSSNRRLPTIGRKRQQLGDADVFVLSRFAYLRRRGNEMVLESPRAGALFRICDPKIAAALVDAVDAATDQTVPAAGRLSRGRTSGVAGGLPDPFQDRRGRRRWPATVRRRRQPRSLGFSRPSVPHPQHGRPASQSAGRALSLCGRDASAARGAAPLARKENRSAQVGDGALGNHLAGRKAAA